MYELTETQKENIRKILKEDDWKEITIKRKSNNKIVVKNDFLIFKRRKNLSQVLKKDPKKYRENFIALKDQIRLSQESLIDQKIQPAKFQRLQDGVNSAYEESKGTPTPTKFFEPADFSKFDSLESIRAKSKSSLVIAYDSEWQNRPKGLRSMLSWQFSVIWDRSIHTFLFIRAGGRDLFFNEALACILDYFSFHYKSVLKSDIEAYSACVDWDGDKPITETYKVWEEAYASGVYKYIGRNKPVSDDGFEEEEETVRGWSREEIPIDDFDKKIPHANINEKGEREWSYFHRFLDFSDVDKIRVTLLCHTGSVDISGLDGTIRLMSSLSDVQGGWVTLQPTKVVVESYRDVNNYRVYPVTLTVADTMCHAPAGKKKLADLGNAIDFHKIDIPTSQKENMFDLLVNDPKLYADYAATDSEVTLLYGAALYGYNKLLPPTIMSATAHSVRSEMCSYFGIQDKEFDKVYRGLETVSHGLAKSSNRPGYIESTSKEPINANTNIVQDFCSNAYHGGYNSCSEVGYFDKTTHDYDLKNAYPTAMALVPDINWENPIKSEVIRREITLIDFQAAGSILNPIASFVGYCTFEFPENVKYCCIPVNVEGVPVYPRTSEGMAGVYVAGPHVYLALRLGAKVYCDRGYFLNSRLTEDLRESHSLIAAVSKFVKERGQAKDFYGKGSLQETLLKVMVNSVYGKNSQNVVQKQTWSSFKDSMEDIGPSCISNPFSAMMTTAIVQCELLAAQNELHEKGFGTYSVTTDGFISDCPIDVLHDLNLYGFKQYMTQARLLFTDGQDPTLWEEKHRQNDLVNFTTRGNVSLESGGVIARNSYKTGFERGSYEDRHALYIGVLDRTGPLACTEEKWASLKEMLTKKSGFFTYEQTRNIRMDFDMKRKPDRNSFRTDEVSLDGNIYEIAHFDTVPFENIAEFRLYRAKKALCKCLRTQKDWDLFFAKVDVDGSNTYIKDLDWSILMSVVMGYRKGLWEIPMLWGETVADKCKIINRHNDSKKRFTVSDWKNARRPERQCNMLPVSMLKDKLEEFHAQIKDQIIS